MFIDISVILARAKSSVFLFDKEKGQGLGGVGGMNLSRSKVLIKEVLGGFSFFGGEGIHFPNFRGEGVVKVDLVIIGSRWGDMVSGLLGEHRGE